MRFYVNIDHVATVREARKTDEPDPVRAAVLVEMAGADGITIHLREDRRHINDRDVRLLHQTSRTGINLELATNAEILDLACELKPMQATLVPEHREEVTTEGGLMLDAASRGVLQEALDRLREAGVRTSLFIDPEPEALAASKEMGADAVELHTGEYANAKTPADQSRQLERLRDSARVGRELGLGVHAGHGLTYENVRRVAAIQDIEELNIGHSVVSRAVFVGLESAVREMAALIRRARSSAGVS